MAKGQMRSNWEAKKPKKAAAEKAKGTATTAPGRSGFLLPPASSPKTGKGEKK